MEHNRSNLSNKLQSDRALIQSIQLPNCILNKAIHEAFQYRDRDLNLVFLLQAFAYTSRKRHVAFQIAYHNALKLHLDQLQIFASHSYASSAGHLLALEEFLPKHRDTLFFL